MASGPITSWQVDGKKMETVTDFIFLVSKITTDGDCSHEIKRHLLLGRKAMTNLDSLLKSRDVILLTKVHVVKSNGFSSSNVWMWVLDHKEGWVPRNWCFQIGAGEDSWESLGQQGDPTCQSRRKSVLNVHWKDWCWSSLWPPDAKKRLIAKDPDAGKD